MRYYKFLYGYLKSDKEYPQFTEISEDEYLENVPLASEPEEEISDSEATTEEYQAALAVLGVQL